MPIRGFRVSPETARRQRMSVEETAWVKEQVVAYILAKPATSKFQATDISRGIVANKKDKNELKRISNLVQRMLDSGMIVRNGDPRKRFTTWSVPGRKRTKTQSLTDIAKMSALSAEQSTSVEVLADKPVEPTIQDIVPVKVTKTSQQSSKRITVTVTIDL